MNHKIATLLREKRITQEEAAKVLGIRQPVFNRKLKGQIPLVLHEIELLAGLLEIPVKSIKAHSGDAQAGDDSGFTGGLSGQVTTLETIDRQWREDVSYKLTVMEGLLRTALDRLDRLNK